MSECRFKPTERMGLYLLIIIIFFCSAHTCSVVDRLETQIDEIEIKLLNIKK